MNRIFLVVVLLGIFSVVSSQDMKSERTARKEAKQLEKLVNYSALGAAIESKKFLLEIEDIVFVSGDIISKNPLLNFISIDSTLCVWQSEAADIPTDLMRVVSKAEGIIDGWKLNRYDKDLRYFLEFKMFTDNGLFYVTVDFNPDGKFTGSIKGVRDRFDIVGRFVKI